MTFDKIKSDSFCPISFHKLNTYNFAFYEKSFSENMSSKENYQGWSQTVMWFGMKDFINRQYYIIYWNS